jgi:Ca2+/Na+ antiporter
MLTGIVIGLGFFALLAYLIYLFVYRKIQMRHEIRLEMIRQGMNPDSESHSYGSAKAGFVSAGVGLALLIGLILDAIGERDPVGAELIIGLVPLMVGLALIAFHHLYGSEPPGRDED